MPRKRPKYNRVINCQRCGILVEHATPVQKYCRECSQIADLERKLKWSHSRPSSPEKLRARREKIRNHMRELGEQINKEKRRGIFWYEEPELSWGVRVAVPFSYALSKNHMWMVSPRGHVHLRVEAKAAREMLAWRIKEALLRGDIKLYQGKVWIDILVQKPNHRGDAINVIDTVCDAVKQATGIDDRWYAIRRLDWEIVKDEPMLYVGISQEVTEDHRVCSYCGRQLPLSQFKSGRRECAKCRGGKRKETVDVIEQAQNQGMAGSGPAVDPPRRDGPMGR